MAGYEYIIVHGFQPNTVTLCYITGCNKIINLDTVTIVSELEDK
ncbi:hypothetical protein SALWKB12_0308 [Snodgrassella communis]|uniref:Uncharacterized protein n=1 Tax=Snodgrassella communis TaxID=2946699 RepID=A0A836MSA4_9NEIS|nr:hypothetical protein SALWKB12_0308 [Snodgrassella communis]KDN15749.1 hypothetical protein SALWKB29_0168 [Snodgrassella communis]